MTLLARIKQLEKLAAARAPIESFRVDPGPYRDDPIGYCRDVLRVHSLTPEQEDILRHLMQPPCRVLVPSGHDTGKTFIAAAAVNWWYDTRNPGACFTLGPRHDSLKDTLWAEVRVQRYRAGLQDDFIGPTAPEMRSAPHHWAKGLTAAKDASLTGRHLPNMLFVIEEACGVDPVFWTVVQTMFDASLGHAQLVIFNPTDTTSQAYLEDQHEADDDGNPRWHRFRLSALNHPNIAAELAGKPRPVPHAVSVQMVRDWVRDWCEPIGLGCQAAATDIEWPPGSGHWYKPGPLFQCRAQGLWPDTGSGVWSDSLWQACFGAEPALPLDMLPCIGCDTATGKGDDYHAIHGRLGSVSLHHETANVMDAARIFVRLKAVAERLAAFATKLRPREARPISPKQIPIRIDDDGTGGAITAFLLADGYTATAIGAGTSADDPTKYPRKRDQLWFASADRAKLGMVRLGRLDRPTQRRLKQQLMAPEWKPDAAGRRQVERKIDTKEKIGRSPDDADAFNLAYYEPPQAGMGLVQTSGRDQWDEWNRRHR